MVKTLQAIADANVVLLLLDATQGVTDQDAHIAGYILDSGRAVVLRSTSGMRSTTTRRNSCSAPSSNALAFLKFAPLLHISAKKRQGLGPVWKAIAEAHASATRKMPTPVLTRLLHEAVEHQGAEARRHVPPKLRYAHQGGMNRPSSSSTAIRSTRHRFVQALPRGRFRAHFQAGRHAAQDRDAFLAESLRRVFDPTGCSHEARSMRRFQRARKRCVNVSVLRTFITEHIVSNKGQLLQDPFLNLLRKEHVPVSIYLVNGIKLQGHIESFDQYVVLLRNTVTQMVCKRDLHRGARPGSELPRQRIARAKEAGSSPPPRAAAKTGERAILVGVDLGGRAPFDIARRTGSAGRIRRRRAGGARRSRAARHRPGAVRRFGQGRRDQGAGRGHRAAGRAVRPGALAGAAAQPRTPSRRGGGRPHMLDPRDLRAARQNHEGKLQVELARLQYLATRWCGAGRHLERQRAASAARGGGRAQIELDRRMIADRISR